MRRTFAAAVRLLVVAAGVLLVCYGVILSVLAYQTRRASQLVEEIQRVSIGDSEESIGPLLDHYNGFRWNVQLGGHEDYNYVLAINPWRFPSIPHPHSGEKVLAIERAFNPRFRRAIGLREWMVDSEIAVKDGRVVAIQSTTIVEGRHMWLGAMWRCSDHPREFDRSADSVPGSPSEEGWSLATSGILDMGSGTGTSWDFWTTPTSPKEQRQMANQLNFGCLRSLSGCETVCDLMPGAARFFKEHPQLAPAGGGWDDSRQTCLKHAPSDYQYW
jgi:hypothetical protein